MPFGESCSSEGTLTSAGRTVLVPAAEMPAAGPVPAPAVSTDDDAAASPRTPPAAWASSPFAFARTRETSDWNCA